MILPVKINSINAVEQVNFSDGSQHQSMNVWLHYDYTDPDTKETEQWVTILTLWDDRIDEFLKADGHKVGDYIMVNVTPSYSRREYQGRTIYKKDLKLQVVN